MSSPPDHDKPVELVGDGGAGGVEPPADELAVGMAEALVEAEGRIRSGKLAGKTLTAAIWILAWPVLLQQTMAACVGMFDKILAGNLRSEIVTPAMDGLGIASYVTWFVGIAMAGLGIGGQALIARAIGRGDVAEAERAVGQAMLLSLAWGVLVAVVLWLLATPVSVACQLSPSASEYLVQYLHTLALAMPLAGVMMVGSMCLHGAGETTKPSLIAIGVNVVNIAVSWVLCGADVRLGGTVLANPFPFDLDVVGIAAGTAVSYGVGAALTWMVLVRGVKDLALRSGNLSFERSMARRIVRVGVPNFFEGISMWAVNLLVLIFIGIIQAREATTEGLQGAHIIAVQWEAFSFMPGFAIGTAAGALAGQYLGAGNPRMAQRAVLACAALAMVIMGALGIVFFLGGSWLTSIVSTEPIHLELVPKLLMICGVMQIFFGLTMVLRQSLRGVGDTKWTFIITTFSSYAIRMPAAYILGVTLGYGLVGVWFALCGEFIIRAALFCTRFAHGGWKRIVV